jgi:hypothetical protein
MTCLPIAEQQCVPREPTTMIPAHAGFLPPYDKSDRQTDMDEPIRCSSPTLEREKHLKKYKSGVVYVHTKFHYFSSVGLKCENSVSGDESSRVLKVIQRFGKHCSYLLR